MATEWMITMKLSEKLYSLRKKSGLSQEGLAEQLNVSRQAISKWESGVSVPESEKLIAISEYFNVSVDYLIKEEIESFDAFETDTRVNKAEVITKYIGLGLCILGFICLVVWGIVIIANPEVSDSIADSSVITVDGRGILLTLCCVLVVIGAVLLLKKQRRR